MFNHPGERFEERLEELLVALRDAQTRGQVHLLNRLQEAENLLNACFEPTAFFTPHCYERHIERGSVLSQAGIALTLVETTTGSVRQEFSFSGDKSHRGTHEMKERLELEDWSRASSDVRVRCFPFQGLDDATLVLETYAPTVDALKYVVRRASEVFDEVKYALELEGTGTPSQYLPPYSLKRAGQVLQLERSYHNPDTGEYVLRPADLIRGTLVQLAVAQQFLELPPGPVNLHELVSGLLPKESKQPLPPLDSHVPLGMGFLAARAQMKSPGARNDQVSDAGLEQLGWPTSDA